MKKINLDTLLIILSITTVIIGDVIDRNILILEVIVLSSVAIIINHLEDIK